jgi:hypothetical protein
MAFGPKTCTYIMLDVYLYQNYFMTPLLLALAFYLLPPPTSYILYLLLFIPLARLLLAAGWSPVLEVEYLAGIKVGVSEAPDSSHSRKVPNKPRI